MKPLAVVGNVNVDLIIGPTAPWPRPGTEVIVDHNDLRVGGSAGNTALAWMARGTPFAIAANVGADRFGTWLRDEFGDHARQWPVRPEGTTLSVGITHPDGERTFFTTRGHLPHFSSADALSVLKHVPLSDGYILLCGAFLTDALTRDYEAIFDWADHQNITIALDTGWPLDGWTAGNCRATLGWLKRCRIALLNEIETTTLTGIQDRVEAAHALKQIMPHGAIVVVKCGPEGAIALDASAVIHRINAPKVTVIDTIGAGDVFNAGFLAALAEDRPLSECLREGVMLASRAISTHPRCYDQTLEGESA